MRAFVSFKRMKFDYCVNLFFSTLCLCFCVVSAKVGEWNDSDKFISVQVGSLILI